MASDDIQGTIVDEDSNAVEGAVVYLFSQDNTTEVISTTTDANGDYIFDSHPDGDGSSQNWHVVAEYDDGSNYYNTYSKPYVNAELSSAIPDSVVTQYRFEDDSDTSTAIDSVGNNDGDITGSPTFDTDSKCGSYSLLCDGNDDEVVSQSTVDLPNNGTSGELSVSGFVKLDDTSSVNEVPFGYYVDNNNMLILIKDANGVWEAFLQINGTNYSLETSTSPSTSSYDQVTVWADSTDWGIIINGSEQSDTHNDDPTNIGTGNLYAGQISGFLNEFDGRLDNISYANERLSVSDADSLASQC